MFPVITRPAGRGLLHFAGQATSVHHAWIVGALASAWRAVAEILIIDGMSPADAESYLVQKLVTESNSPLMRKPEELDMESLGQRIALGSALRRKA